MRESRTLEYKENLSSNTFLKRSVPMLIMAKERLYLESMIRGTSSA